VWRGASTNAKATSRLGFIVGADDMRMAAAALALGVLLHTSARAQETKTMRVYHLGNSPGLAELYARDNTLVPGWKPETGIEAGVNIFYADGIHPNPIPHLTGNLANYVNGLTLFAVIAGETPVGMTGTIYGLDDEQDAALIEAVQEAIWEVLRLHPSR
jgi:hypothetical protein